MSSSGHHRIFAAGGISGAAPASNSSVGVTKPPTSKYRTRLLLGYHVCLWAIPWFTLCFQRYLLQLWCAVLISSLGSVALAISGPRWIEGRGGGSGVRVWSSLSGRHSSSGDGVLELPFESSDADPDESTKKSRGSAFLKWRWWTRGGVGVLFRRLCASCGGGSGRRNATIVLRLGLFWLVQLQLCQLVGWVYVKTTAVRGDRAEDRLKLNGTDAVSLLRGGVAGSAATAAAGDLAGQLPKFSIVLPCANEGVYAYKTAKGLWERTPADVLREIVIVDDGSDPPLKTLFSDEDEARFKVKWVRHEQFTGLINAKQKGGDAATGDILVFFDCHVKPEDSSTATSSLRTGGGHSRGTSRPTTDALSCRW